MKKLLKQVKACIKPPYTKNSDSVSDPEEETEKRLITLENVKAATRRFHTDNFVAKGRTCTVYKGWTPDMEIVAFKLLSKEDRFREFKAEKEFLRYVFHENIVQMILADSNDEKVCILVLEYLPNETLLDRLKGTKRKILSWEKRMIIALGVARAVQYIHTVRPGPVVHRDVKSTHIVMDAKDNPKLIEFGNAILEPMDKKDTFICGTEPYTAPEYKSLNRLSTCCDIYGLGVVLMELITGLEPIQNGQTIIELVSSKLTADADWDVVVPNLIDEKVRADVPQKDMRKIMTLATDCTRLEFLDRPAASQVVSRLMELSCLTRASPSSSTGAIKQNLDPILEE